MKHWVRKKSWKVMKKRNCVVASRSSTRCVLCCSGWGGLRRNALIMRLSRPALAYHPAVCLRLKTESYQGLSTFFFFPFNTRWQGSGNGNADFPGKPFPGKSCPLPLAITGMMWHISSPGWREQRVVFSTGLNILRCGIIQLTCENKTGRLQPANRCQSSVLT